MKSKKFLVAMGFMTILSLTACATTEKPNNSNTASQENTKVENETGFIIYGPDDYDSIDQAVVLKIDKEASTITFLNRDLYKKYTLEYDGTTKLHNKYGEGINIDMVSLGDLVDVCFVKEKKHLTSLDVSKTAWVIKGADEFLVNSIKQNITVGEDIYKLTQNTQYFSNGEKINLYDLNENDVLTITGIDTEVISIIVDKGHGYLRLVNDEHFIGGWIEVGQTAIQPITEDMLLTVPEGSYQVEISNKGSSGIKNVKIKRDTETTLDIGDIQVDDIQYGTVIFTLIPEDGILYVDGEKVDVTKPLELSYGIHQMIAMADGYETITKYLKLGQESAGVSISLEKTDSKKDDSTKTDTTTNKTESSEKDSNKTETENKDDDTITSYYKLKVESPEGVEVYLDGSYVGISPCSFKKSAGIHVITLRKNGYETRSFTIQVGDEKKDETISFADLEKAQE